MGEIRLSPKQQMAIESQADICIFGGGNGPGKTQGLIWTPLQPDYLSRPGCTSVIFAESVPKLKQPGGLVDKTMAGTVRGILRGYAPVHPLGLDGYNKTDRRWTFPTTPGQDPSTITLSYIGEPGQWDGGEFALVLIDQVEQVEEAQFFSLVSRNRTTCGARCRILATANPPEEGPTHWLTKMLAVGGYLDQYGYPVPEMSGVVRWMIRTDDSFMFGDTAEELLEHAEKDRDGKPIRPKSFTFIPTLIDDHPDPEFREAYKQQLALLPEAERMRRLRGNWFTVEMAGKYFRREFFPIVEYVPPHNARLVRSWDSAWSTDQHADWTPGVLFAGEANRCTVMDLIRIRGTYAHVERAVKMIAELDGRSIVIRLPRDAGAAGGLQSDLALWLGARGYEVVLSQDKGDKLTRSRNYNAFCENRGVRLAKSHPSREIARLMTQPFEVSLSDGERVQIDGLDVSNVSTLNEWHESFFADHVRFGRATIHKRSIKKDVVDACVGAYEVLVSEAGRDPADVDDATIRYHLQQAQRDLAPAPHGSIWMGRAAGRSGMGSMGGQRGSGRSGRGFGQR